MSSLTYTAEALSISLVLYVLILGGGFFVRQRTAVATKVTDEAATQSPFIKSFEQATTVACTVLLGFFVLNLFVPLEQRPRWTDIPIYSVLLIMGLQWSLGTLPGKNSNIVTRLFGVVLIALSIAITIQTLHRIY